MIEVIKTFFRQFKYTKSFSQFGEDVVIQSLFRNKKNGIYVDVGAYQPILYSNTHALYLKGWHGLSIDPNPSFKILYKIFRRRDTFANFAVGDATKHKYFMFSDGAYNTLSEVVAKDLMSKKYPSFLGTKEVNSLPLSEIIKKYKITHIDYMNIDVEGLDLEVLKSHDWSIKPSVISVEDSDKEGIGSLLSQHGYKLTAYVGKSLIYKLNV
ncbi:FkbM family methyltransferase [candidate division KSB1 bacterium]